MSKKKSQRQSSSETDDISKPRKRGSSKAKRPPEPAVTEDNPEVATERRLGERAGQLTQLPRDVLSLVKRYAGMAVRVTDSAAYSAEQFARLSGSERRLLKETGELIGEFRKLAGFTYEELATALDLEDQSLLKALEAGTATLSFEFILRLASVLARHDPIPFALQLIRAYQPGIWQFLERWGVGLWPVQYERERRFINIYRQNDEARQLDDAQFKAALALTQRAFDVGVHWLLEHSEPDEDIPEPTED